MPPHPRCLLYVTSSAPCHSSKTASDEFYSERFYFLGNNIISLFHFQVLFIHLFWNHSLNTYYIKEAWVICCDNVKITVLTNNMFIFCVVSHCGASHKGNTALFRNSVTQIHFGPQFNQSLGKESESYKIIFPSFLSLL